MNEYFMEHPMGMHHVSMIARPRDLPKSYHSIYLAKSQNSGDYRSFGKECVFFASSWIL